MAKAFLGKLQLCTVCLLILGSCHARRGIIHRVETGENLTQIAHVYGVNLRELLRANHLRDPDFLRPGQKLLIPGADRVQRTNVFEVKEVAESVKPAPQKVAVAKPAKDKGTLRLRWPVPGKVISPFGRRGEKMHNGIDIAAAPGAAVKAAGPGTVMYRGDDLEGYGNLVILGHGGQLFTVYAYLAEIKVAKGKKMEAGEVLGVASRDAAKAFVHFEVRRGKKALDPVRLLPK